MQIQVVLQIIIMHQLSSYVETEQTIIMMITSVDWTSYESKINFIRRMVYDVKL